MKRPPQQRAPDRLSLAEWRRVELAVFDLHQTVTVQFAMYNAYSQEEMNSVSSMAHCYQCEIGSIWHMRNVG
jgi:hypothetical protein